MLVTILTSIASQFLLLWRDRDQRKAQREDERTKWERDQERLRVEWARQQEAVRRKDLREVYAYALYHLGAVSGNTSNESRGEAVLWLNRLLVDFPDAGEARRTQYEDALARFSEGAQSAKELEAQVRVLARGDRRLQFPG
jgi:hypothetical protein